MKQFHEIIEEQKIYRYAEFDFEVNETLKLYFKETDILSIYHVVWSNFSLKIELLCYKKY